MTTAEATLNDLELYTDPDEERLLRRCQAGERPAFEPLVIRYRERAYFFALGLTGNEEDARDISQEAFVRAFQNLNRFRIGLPFYPWFHRILRNLCYDHLSRRSRRGETSLDSVVCAAIPGTEGDPEESAIAAERRKAVWEAIQDLSPGEREIIILREFQDHSYADIARILGCPRGTVMSRLFYARRRLREKLNGRI